MSAHQARSNQAIRSGDLAPIILLIIVSVGYLLMGLWLRQIRWINPDEGAHIADAILLLDGKVPVVDFPSRQPLYILFLAIDLAVLGPSLAAARVAPLVATILTGVLVYFFIRLRFGPSYALAGSLTYLLLPLTLSFATVVKMEPFALALGTVAAICCVAALSGDRAAAWLFPTGLLIAGSFYVRESTAYALGFASLGSVILFNPRKHASRLPAMTWLLGGVLCGFLLAFGLFAPHMGLAGYLGSPLHPLNIVFRTTERLSSVPFRSQPVDQTFDAIRLLIYSYTFLIFGSLLGIGTCFLSSVRLRYRTDISVFCGLWLGGLLIVYILRALTGAIYPSYGREFIVPAIVLTLAGIRWLWNSLQPYLITPERDRPLLTAAISCQVLLVVGQLFLLREPQFVFFISLLLLIALCRVRIRTNGDIEKPSFGGDRLWLYAAGILCAGVLIRTLTSLAKPILGPDIYFYLTLGALSLITCVVLRQRYLSWPAIGVVTVLVALVSSSLYSLSNSAAMLDPRFHSVWSPSQLSRVAKHLGEHVPKDGRVLSGANIWTIEAGRKMFADVTHPLALMVPDKYVGQPYRRIGDLLRESPPDAIILDGYTEKTYGSHWDLAELIKDRYSGGENVTIAGGSEYPLVIYIRNDAARANIPGRGYVDAL